MLLSSRATRNFKHFFGLPIKPKCFMHLGVCVGSGKIFLMLMYEDSRRTSLQEFGTRGRGEGGSLGAVTIKDKPHSPVWCWNLVGIPFPANLLLRILRRIFKIDLLSLMIFRTGGLHSAKRRLLTRYLGTFSNYWTREQSPYGEVSLYS